MWFDEERMNGQAIKPKSSNDSSPPVLGASRIIWTLGAIAARIGTGPDFVRDTLAQQPGSPVKEIGGRYYAFEDDLISFLKR